MDPISQFKQERHRRISDNGCDDGLNQAADRFLKESLRVQYSYNFSWLGRPIIQYPQDIMALQEIVWTVQPDLIVETGIAHGGSLVFFASLLELLGKNGLAVGIDVDIRSHNRAEIEKHPFFHRLHMIEGSSVDIGIFEQVLALARNRERIMVCLDSNHTRSHVLEELNMYAPLVSKGSYIVVFDGIIETVPEYTCENRPWGPGNNPLSAIQEFLNEHPEFQPDQEIQNKLLVTAAPSGYLKRIG